MTQYLKNTGIKTALILLVAILIWIFIPNVEHKFLKPIVIGIILGIAICLNFQYWQPTIIVWLQEKKEAVVLWYQENVTEKLK